MRPAVVLLSGGLDSATALALAVRDGFAAHCLTVAYGQRHAVEVKAAARVARALGAASHRIVAVDLAAFGGSALTGGLEVPKDRAPGAMAGDIPPTYVPARNTVFLALALALAETLGATDLFIGANQVDFSGYPDCRPAFIEAFEALANVATKLGVEGARFKVHATLMNLNKKEIISLGLSMGVDYGITHSCYDPPKSGRACGRCDACLIRRRAFEELGLRDPAPAA
jgi:7-cyano-7-deazaguanine synthase